MISFVVVAVVVVAAAAVVDVAAPLLVAVELRAYGTLSCKVTCWIVCYLPRDPPDWWTDLNRDHGTICKRRRLLAGSMLVAARSYIPEPVPLERSHPVDAIRAALRK